MKVTNIETCIIKARMLHGTKYDYSKAIYIKCNIKLIVICPIHGEFEVTPSNHTNDKNPVGCKLCAHQKRRRTIESFIEKANLLHDNFYSYDNAVYVNTHTRLIITCPIHGNFLQSPVLHIGKNACGCPSCINHPNVDTKEFIRRSIEIHRNRYTYERVVYTRRHDYVTITCSKHGDFLQTPNNHLNKLHPAGCPDCCTNRHSQKAIKWLEYIMEQEKIQIQHAENKGELKIPKTKYKADGYCINTNTIYEFHGNCWHGNPRLYKPDDKPNFRLPNTTAKELYEKTLKKEQKILELGYNLVVMWEDEWDNVMKTKDN